MNNRSAWSRVLLISGLAALIAFEVQAQPFLSISSFSGDGQNPFGPNITGMVQDCEGMLWISSFGGLYRYDGRAFTRYRPITLADYEVTSDRIDSLCLSESGNILCKMDDVVEFDPVREVFVRSNKTMPASDSDVITRNPSVRTRDGQEFSLTDGGTCIRTVSGNGRYDIPLPADVRKGGGGAVFYEDARGRLWLIFTSSGEILFFDADAGAFLRPESPYRPDDEIRHFYQDNQGGLWFIMYHKIDHVLLYDSPAMKLADMPDDEVRFQMCDSSGQIWVATRDGRIQLFDAGMEYLGNVSINGRLVRNRLQTFIGDAVFSILEDSSGIIWIGTRHSGLFRLDKSDGNYSVTQVPVASDNGISSPYIFSLAEDGQGRVWVGSFEGGIDILSKDGVLHCLDGMHVRIIKSLSRGLMLVGAREGLFVLLAEYDGDKVREIKWNHIRPGNPGRMPDNDVMSICETSNGEVWIATASGGVARIVSSDLFSDALSFESYSVRNGLASDITSAIAETPDGALWVIGEQTLSRIDPLRENMYSLGEANFAHSMIFSHAHPLLHGDRLLIGTFDGIYALDWNIYNVDTQIPPVRIVGMSINNNLKTGKLTDNVIRLGRKERSLTLFFSVLDFKDHSHMRYAYKLDGLDKDWTETMDPAVTYLNLPPGKMIFCIRSTDIIGHWADNENRYIIDVEPYFYETLIGKLCILLLVCSFVVAVSWFLFRFFRLKERLIMEEELTETKLRYFTDISHELRTPLTLVEGPISEVLEREPLSTESRSFLQTAQTNVRRILDLVNQILDFRKIQNGKMNLLLEQTDVVEEIHSIVADFNEMTRKYEMGLTVITEGEIPELWVDVDKFDKIFFNLISNAFKYSPAGREICVRIRPEGKYVDFYVEDQGVGINKVDLPFLFERFETAGMRSNRGPSSGLGLSLVRRFTELHQGEVSVESEPGKGSVFCVRLPQGRHCFEGLAGVEFIVGKTARA